MSIQEAAARARHDLGKYIAFSARWLGPDAAEADLREALRDDLTRTRKGPEGTTGAAALWQTLRTPLAGVEGVEAVDSRMRTLAARVAALDTLDLADLQDTARIAREVADHLKALHARTRE